MTVVRALTPVVYTSELGASIGFYQLLGFESVMHGDDGEWAWSYERCGDVSLLVASGGSIPQDAGPVTFYFQTDDVAGLQERLREADVPVEHLGHPDHAPGGEIRVLDPDRRVVMVAQTTGAPALALGKQPDNRTSILNQAADALRRRDQTPHACEIPMIDGERCSRPAEVKLADSWADNAWSCLPHADEVLFTVRGAFLAAEDAEGLGPYLSRRRRARA